jgi:NTP pyrophosphatase (non-canonical NTP hydrolase)
MDEQERVAAFASEHDLDATAPFRVLDLVAEIGEIAADAAKSAEYGQHPADLDVAEDEIGDALFSLLLVADSLNVDAGEALETSVEKYRQRLDATGDAGSE